LPTTIGVEPGAVCASLIPKLGKDFARVSAIGCSM
jgi:hypothetical protein